VDVVFDAKRDAGDVKIPIHITTDLGEKFSATLTAYATIAPSETPPVTKDGSEAGPSADAGNAANAGTPRVNVAGQ
jgi:hypothetical protein